MACFTCSNGWIKNDEKLHTYIENIVKCDIIPGKFRVWIISELVITGKPDFLVVKDSELVYDLPDGATGFFCKSSKHHWSFKGIGARKNEWSHFLLIPHIDI